MNSSHMSRKSGFLSEPCPATSTHKGFSAKVDYFNVTRETVFIVFGTVGTCASIGYMRLY